MVKALQSARQTPPDLILLDINMSGLSGYEVAAQLKQDTRLGGPPFSDGMDISCQRQSQKTPYGAITL
jgi:CheY-like chemotaxis protein